MSCYGDNFEIMIDEDDSDDTTPKLIFTLMVLFSKMPMTSKNKVPLRTRKRRTIMRSYITDLHMGYVSKLEQEADAQLRAEEDRVKAEGFDMVINDQNFTKCKQRSSLSVP